MVRPPLKKWMDLDQGLKGIIWYFVDWNFAILYSGRLCALADEAEEEYFVQKYGLIAFREKEWKTV